MPLYPKNRRGLRPNGCGNTVIEGWPGFANKRAAKLLGKGRQLCAALIIWPMAGSGAVASRLGRPVALEPATGENKISGPGEPSTSTRNRLLSGRFQEAVIGRFCKRPTTTL